MLRQCEKYAFVSLKRDIDERLARATDTLHPAFEILASAKEGRRPIVDLEMDVFEAVKEFDLPECEEAIVSYVLKIKDEIEECKTRKVAAHNQASDNDFEVRLTRFLREMHEAGRYRICSLFMITGLDQVEKDEVRGSQ